MEGNVVALLNTETMSATNLKEMTYHSGAVPDHLVYKPESWPADEQQYYYQRIRKLATLVKGVPGFTSSSRLLFVGVGTGMEAFYSDLPMDNAVCTDIDPQRLVGLVKRFVTKGRRVPGGVATVDAENLPFANDSFDIGIAFEALHHCNIPMKALSELVRCSRLGVVVFDSWDCQLQWWAKHLGLGSKPEYSGVVPNRFGRYTLWAFGQNNGLEYPFRSVGI